MVLFTEYLPDSSAAAMVIGFMVEPVSNRSVLALFLRFSAASRLAAMG